MSQMQVPDNQTLLNGWHIGWYRNVHLANWLWRVLAGVIDYILVPWPILFVAGFFVSSGRTLWVITYIVWWLNSALLQGHTGQSVGKRLTGQKVFYPKITREEYLATDFPGVGRCTWRLFCHIFDFMLICIEWIRPLLHPYRQTFADSLSHTYVGKDRKLYLERSDGAYDGPTSFSK